ncbi:MAG: formylglycine-generating enzyme family protein [Sphingomonadaceae bacterium]|nr:formylglycine-generating enzyme family protein [Sphingomonadaceae bacterium]
MRRLIAIAALMLAGCGESPDTADVAEMAAQADTPSCLTADLGETVLIEGGSFVMGADPRLPEEGPPREMTVESFRIDAHEVTNAQFAAFVEATGYVTVAERDPPPLPGAPPEMLQPGSAVFTTPSRDDPRWWRWVVGAEWRHPSGPDSDIADAANQPVVQVAYEDAQAYAEWAGGALPSEAQWEYAALGGEAARDEPMSPNGTPSANFYQGVFPRRDLGEDGFTGRAPAGCYPPNGYGLYDMIGNVWEWTTAEGRGVPDAGVIKGGSFLCAANYCARYRPAARQFQERGLGADHIGFRVVYTVE